MNAHTRTALDLASALSGKPRAAQTVKVLLFAQRVGENSRFEVLVTPEGGEGRIYECSGAGLERLTAGMTPEDLGLEPVTPPEPEDEDQDEADFREYRERKAYERWMRDVTPRRL